MKADFFRINLDIVIVQGTPVPNYDLEIYHTFLDI